MNLWVEFLIEVKEMRERQKDYFKNKNPKETKKLVAFAKLCEMKVDQMTVKLEESCQAKGINLNKPKDDESTVND